MNNASASMSIPARRVHIAGRNCVLGQQEHDACHIGAWVSEERKTKPPPNLTLHHPRCSADRHPAAVRVIAPFVACLVLRPVNGVSSTHVYVSHLPGCKPDRRHGRLCRSMVVPSRAFRECVLIDCLCRIWRQLSDN